jgi:serine/threonine protein kinase
LEILVYLQSHTSVIIHRDIKPENVLIDEQLNVYLIDFGFAQIGDGEVAMSNSTSGTLGFMAPEQIYNKETTKATDLYGLGTMLIALLTRTKSTAMDVLIDDDGKIAFKHLVPKLNLRFVNWLEKMIAPNLKERYPNAEVALKELQPLHAIRDPFVTIKLYRIQIGLAALGLASLMMLTNPRRDSYVEYASWKFTADAEKIICKNPALPDFINNAPGVAELCKTIVSSRRKDIIELVDSLSKQDNYIFFSIYTTRIAGNEYRTLGIFSNFWTFESK